MSKSPIDSRVRIGHVHLKVADLDQAWAFTAAFSALYYNHASAPIGPLAQGEGVEMT